MIHASNLPVPTAHNHLMIDMETLGDRSNSVILSIAVVPFCIESGSTVTPFYEKIDIQSSLDAGLQVTGSTIKWWFNQPNELNYEILSDAKKFSFVMSQLAAFIGHCTLDAGGENVYVQSRGRRFEIGLLADAFTKAGYQVPWYHSNERDVRTLEALRPSIKDQTDFIGQRHHALDDCYYQIKYCNAIWRDLHQPPSIEPFIIAA